MLLVAAVACVFAGGVWIVASAVWPAPRRLGAALDELNAVSRGGPAFVSADGYQPSFSLSMGRWLLKRLKASTLADEHTASDLELVGRPALNRFRHVQAAIRRQAGEQRRRKRHRRAAVGRYEAHVETMRAPCVAIGEM